MENLNDDYEVSVTEGQDLEDVEEVVENSDVDAELDANEFKVEKILGRRTRQVTGKLTTEYKVRWEGYGDAFDSWGEESTLHCEALLEDYNAQNVADNDGDAAGELMEVDLNEPLPDGQYVVEKILSSRPRKSRGPRKTEYLVQWKDYPGQDSWEVDVDAPQLMKAFLDELPSKHRASVSSSGKSAGPRNQRFAVIKAQSPASHLVGKRRSSKSVVSRTSRRLSKDGGEASAELQQSADEVYEVVQVLNKRKRGTGLNSYVEYLIQWKGYSEPSWEAEDKLDCSQLIKGYEDCIKASTKDFTSKGVAGSSSRRQAVRMSPFVSRQKPLAMMSARGKPMGKPYPVSASAVEQAVTSSRSTRGTRKDDQAEILSQYLQQSPLLSVSKRYPRRGRCESSPSVSQAIDNVHKKGAKIEKKGTARMTTGGPSAGLRAAQKKSAKVPSKTDSILEDEFSKELVVYLLKGSEILAMKTFRYDPQDVIEGKLLMYDAAEIQHKEEAVKIIGKANLPDFPEDVFYLVKQGSAPELLLGVTEEFMRERYPQTMAELDPELLLHMGREEAGHDD